MTPITLRLIPSTVMDFPRMFGSAAKRLRQSSSLSTATPGEPRCSSWAAKVLPIAGLHTQNRKETRCDEPRRQANGVSRSGQGDLIAVKSRDALKGVGPPLEFEIVVVRQAEAAAGKGPTRGL